MRNFTFIHEFQSGHRLAQFVTLDRKGDDVHVQQEVFEHPLVYSEEDCEELSIYDEYMIEMVGELVADMFNG